MGDVLVVRLPNNYKGKMHDGAYMVRSALESCKVVGWFASVDDAQTEIEASMFIGDGGGWLDRVDWMGCYLLVRVRGTDGFAMWSIRTLVKGKGVNHG